MSEIDGLIQRLDAWLRENRPEYYTRLNPGASDEEIAELETSLGWKLPEDFVAFYKWKNGARSVPNQGSGQCFEFIFYWYFLSVEGLIFQVKSSGFISQWLVFSIDGSGDHLILDSSGVETNNHFQIIEDVKGDMSFILNRSFSKWLECQIRLMESGDFTIFMTMDSFSVQDMGDWNRSAWLCDPGYPIPFDTTPYLA